VIPPEVIDRPKGYFPVPALKYLQGPYLELVRDALHAPEARQRGCSRTPTWPGC
jgi:asparagine synthase (glutamine-hydrolysing)